jgi:hypothetical protein
MTNTSNHATDQPTRSLAGHEMSQPTPSVAAARQLMTSALGYIGPQETQRLALAEALAVLSDVVPPYPPLPQVQPVAPGTDLFELTALVLEYLRAALDEVDDITALTRVATAAIVLRRGGGVAA